jgi:PAS domain S-box-containing protein
MFQLLFERSEDAIWLFDPVESGLIDCNPAAVRLMRAREKGQLLGARPAELWPPAKPDDCIPDACVGAVSPFANTQEAHRSEWVGRRFDGSEACLEMTSIRVDSEGRIINVVIARDVSDRKKAEQAILDLNQNLERRILERTSELAASEAQLRTLIEHAPEAIVVFGGETGRFLLCNENATRLFGLSRPELLMRRPEDVSPEFQLDGRTSCEVAAEKIQEALAGGIPHFEWVHRHADGRLIACEVRLVRLPGEGPPLIRASIIDNTDRRRREKVQRATFQISEAVHMAEDLASLYRHIHTIIAGLMPAENLYIALLDPHTQTICFEYYVDQHSPRPDPQPMNAGLTSVVLRTGRPLLVGKALEARKKRVGREVTFEGLIDNTYVESGKPAAIWLGVPLIMQGKPVGVVAVQDYRNDKAYDESDQDILTFVAGQIALAIERKRNEQALRDSEHKFRALFQASSQGVILHDENMMLEVNPACLRILGFSSPSEMIGRHPAETSAPIQPNGETADVMARKHIQDCLQNGSGRFEWVARNSQGREVPIEVVLTRIELGGKVLIQAVFNDITQRKQAEADLLRTLARERELGQLKSSFVSLVSHEFRTPLGIIESSAEILRDYFPRLTESERDEQLASITKNTRRMAKLMEEVLVLSRFDAGKMELKPAPVNFRVFCSRLVDEVRSATDRRCPIDLLVTATLPEAAADERLLNHIFTNLLTNAVKYSDPGAPVTFRVRQEQGDAVCEVSDRGIGIPEDDLPGLFIAFQRARNVGDRQGTGLGLVLVKRCVELHRGGIEIRSKVGEGTTVTVRLPLFTASI